MQIYLKNIYNYRWYLTISLISLLGGCVLNVLQLDVISSETFAIVAFFFFTVAVVLVALEEFPASRKNIVKKIKPFLRVWKKLKKH